MATLAQCKVRIVVGLAALSAASLGQAQTVPKTTDFSTRLPSIPLTSPVSAPEIALEALPGVGGAGVTVAPGVIVDRVVRPRCVFIANQNSGGGSVRQTADVGSVRMYCP